MWIECALKHQYDDAQREAERGRGREYFSSNKLSRNDSGFKGENFPTHTHTHTLTHEPTSSLPNMLLKLMVLQGDQEAFY